MKEASWLQDELERAKKLGLTVQIEGQPCKYSNPEEFSYVLEEPAYMLDYMSDDEGRITGICFEKVNEDHFVRMAYSDKRRES